MIVINNTHELEQYYNPVVDAYEFKKTTDSKLTECEAETLAHTLNCVGDSLDDVYFATDVNVTCDIHANDIITHHDISARHVYANDILAHYVQVTDLYAHNIDVFGLSARLVDAHIVNASSIYATELIVGDILANKLNATRVEARDVNATVIQVDELSYFAMCIAHKVLRVKSAQGAFNTSVCMCIDPDYVITEEDIK